MLHLREPRRLTTSSRHLGPDQVVSTTPRRFRSRAAGVVAARALLRSARVMASASFVRWLMIDASTTAPKKHLVEL